MTAPHTPSSSDKASCGSGCLSEESVADWLLTDTDALLQMHTGSSVTYNAFKDIRVQRTATYIEQEDVYA